MKYEYKNQPVPQEKREEVNNKILYLIDNNLLNKHNITNEMIYNLYTGGVQHGLKFKDFGSFYSYSEAKRDLENGQFFSPHNIAKFMMDFLKPSDEEFVADITGGSGVFCNFAPVENNMFINDLDLRAIKVARQLYPNANITNDDIRFYSPMLKFDLIVGNPPFSLKLRVDKDEYKSEYYFCMKSARLLKAGGLFCFICPKSFLEDELEKYQKEFLNQNFNFIFQFELPKNAFKHVGVDNFQTKIMLFQRKSEHIKEERVYSNEYIKVDELSEEESNRLYNTYVKGLYDVKESIKAKLYFENKKDNGEEKEFLDKVFKLLYDIRRNPKTKDKYSKCWQCYNEYYTQSKPEGMDQKEWAKKRLTKKKVIARLKKALQSQNEVSRDEIKLVKTAYGLKLKGYSHKNKLYLSKFNGIKEMSFNDMILKGVYPFEDKSYKKLFDRKLKEYEEQDRSFKEMTEDKGIDEWLDNLVIRDYEKKEDIRLKDTQKEVVNKLLQKRYSFLQSGMGSGKSLMSISYALYRKEFNNTRNTIVISVPIAIDGTWDQVLQDYKIPFIRIRNLKDIQSVKQNDFVLITPHVMSKYKKQLKTFLNSINNNYLTIVDESDFMCNMSKRAKLVLDIFKYSKWKLCMSGTITRNNITESYNQFQFLYNSSVNFLCECETAFEEDKETKDLKEISNHENYMKPFKPYRRGFSVFKSCYNPQKITVFGQGKNTQDIYNSKLLKKLIDKTLITRTFEQIVGKKIYEIKQHLVPMNEAERNLYNKAINEFYSMKYLFTSTGNARKDKFLEIIQQLNLLLNTCYHPQTYKEYSSKEKPNKYKKVLSMVNQWKDERVAIGCRTLKEVDLYRCLLSGLNRNIYIITGSVSMERRRDIIYQLKNDENGILISTQQSLSSSLNIGFVGKVIVSSLPYNYSVLAQFFFRFIRLTSTDFKEIHFVSYKNSIECNLLSLILSKEKLNNFFRDGQEDKDMESELGVDFDLINMLLTREKDSEGRSYIRWGQQEIN